MTENHNNHRAILQSIAHRVMLERGLLPDFSSQALAELAQLQHPAAAAGTNIRDLRNLLWASIDNDDSRDLDQLTVAEALPGDNVKVLVAVADVDKAIGAAKRRVLLRHYVPQPPDFPISRAEPAYLKTIWLRVG